MDTKAIIVIWFFSSLIVAFAVTMIGMITTNEGKPTDKGVVIGVLAIFSGPITIVGLALFTLFYTIGCFYRVIRDEIRKMASNK